LDLFTDIKRKTFKNGIFKTIQEIASKLFAENKIDYFVGTNKLFDDNQVPFLITDPAEIPTGIYRPVGIQPGHYLKPDHTKRKRSDW